MRQGDPGRPQAAKPEEGNVLDIKTGKPLEAGAGNAENSAIENPEEFEGRYSRARSHLSDYGLKIYREVGLALPYKQAMRMSDTERRTLQQAFLDRISTESPRKVYEPGYFATLQVEAKQDGIIPNRIRSSREIDNVTSEEIAEEDAKVMQYVLR